MPDGFFALSVLTPEAKLLEVLAKAIVLRSSDGDFTVLDGHTPLVTDVVPGDVRVDEAEGESVHIAVHGGYLQVETGLGIDGSDERSTRVTLLAPIAELSADIDVPRAERALERAQARVEELRATAGRSGGTGGGGGGGGGEAVPGETASREDLELAEAEGALRRAEVRLEVAGARTAA